MSQRKTVATKTNDLARQTADVLHQYEDTDGHFSLVR